MTHHITTEQAKELITKHYEKTGKKLNIPTLEACCLDSDCDLCRGRGFAFGSFGCDVPPAE